MSRLSALVLAAGLAVITLGLLFSGLGQHQNVALAALPAGHPPVQPGQAAELPFQTVISATINDMFVPGSQQGQITASIVSPEECTGCHAFYNDLITPTNPAEYETWRAWRGSMMSQASRDPVFWAALDIAKADVGAAAEFCLRCHTPSAWLEGRTYTLDRSLLTDADMEGVQCELCHRLVDPVYTPDNPDRDPLVLATINPLPANPGSASYIIDPEDERRGPFDLQEDWTTNPHSVLGLPWPLVSPYHQEAALCGSCHNIDNPLFSWDEDLGEYVLNAYDTPGDFSNSLPLERTYSEWLLSDYNTPGGVFAPQFGGNKTFVSTCQDCHMRDITGVAGVFPPNYVVREDMPLHDLTGVNTWVPQTILLHPEFSANFEGQIGAIRAEALISGTLRARYMLQNAATMDLDWNGDQLTVTVFNQSGHKLPTGYIEGRRMWLQIEAYDSLGNLIFTSGAYDAATGELIGYHTDPTLKVYEAEAGLTQLWADQISFPAGPSFHFLLNNVMIHDNRIPPRGYEFAAFNAAGAAPYSNSLPDPTLYADGQYWDTTVYDLPGGAAYGVVRLVHQVASAEYIQFLVDNNPYGPGNDGEILYDLWELTGRSAPETMIEMTFGQEALYLPLIERP